MTTDIQNKNWYADSLAPSRLWVLLLALPVVAVMAFVIFQPIQVLPRIALAPGFALIDQDGERLTNEDLRGKLVLYHFTYSHCEENCPQTIPVMHELQAHFATLDTGEIPVELVTIFFDATRDTPARLQKYAAEAGADLSNWHFVTGEAHLLKQIIGGGFNTYFDAQPDGTFVFDPVFVLVDGWGITRAYYRTAQPDPEIVTRDVGLVVKELQADSGINRYAYEAAHLFSCYPR
jgi:protein SCO1